MPVTAVQENTPHIHNRNRIHVCEDMNCLDQHTLLQQQEFLVCPLPQVRGSVPLFWSQEASGISAKPDIILQQFDPLFEVSCIDWEIVSIRWCKCGVRDTGSRCVAALSEGLVDWYWAAGPMSVWLGWCVGQISFRPRPSLT